MYMEIYIFLILNTFIECCLNLFPQVNGFDICRNVPIVEMLMVGVVRGWRKVGRVIKLAGRFSVRNAGQ